MARRGRGAALVLVAPYRSIPDLARRIAGWLPVSLIVGDRFDIIAKAGAIRDLEENLRDAETDGQRRAAAREHETLTRPVDQMFARLKTDLARLVPEEVKSQK
jgi:hypothetical protein